MANKNCGYAGYDKRWGFNAENVNDVLPELTTHFDS